MGVYDCVIVVLVWVPTSTGVPCTRSLFIGQDGMSSSAVTLLVECHEGWAACKKPDSIIM